MFNDTISTTYKRSSTCVYYRATVGPLSMSNGTRLMIILLSMKRSFMMILMQK